MGKILPFTPPPRPDPFRPPNKSGIDLKKLIAQILVIIARLRKWK